MANQRLQAACGGGHRGEGKDRKKGEREEGEKRVKRAKSAPVDSGSKWHRGKCEKKCKSVSLGEREGEGKNVPI